MKFFCQSQKWACAFPTASLLPVLHIPGTRPSAFSPFYISLYLRGPRTEGLHSMVVLLVAVTLDQVFPGSCFLNQRTEIKAPISRESSKQILFKGKQQCTDQKKHIIKIESSQKMKDIQGHLIVRRYQSVAKAGICAA